MHKNTIGWCISQASFSSRVSEIVLHFSLLVTMMSIKQDFGTLAKPAQVRDDLYWNWCRLIRFRPPTSKGVAAVASYPGSGVTWLRYLLQQATGVATGSLYPDEYFQSHGFPGDDKNDKSVLVVNTHEYPAHRKYSKVILLIRDPMEAIIYNFKGQSAEFVTPEEINMMALMKHPGWNYKFVEKQARKWKNYYMAWLSDMTSAIHVAFYDGIKKKPREQLENILNFIEFNGFSEDDISCAVQRKDQFWLRGSISKYPLDPYSKLMKAAVNDAKTTVYQELRRRFMVTLIEKDGRRRSKPKECKTWRNVGNKTVECLQDIGKNALSF